MRKIIMFTESGGVMKLPEHETIKAIHNQGLSKQLEIIHLDKKANNRSTMLLIAATMIPIMYLIVATIIQTIAYMKG